MCECGVWGSMWVCDAGRRWGGEAMREWICGVGEGGREGVEREDGDRGGGRK